MFHENNICKLIIKDPGNVTFNIESVNFLFIPFYIFSLLFIEYILSHISQSKNLDL